MKKSVDVRDAKRKKINFEIEELNYGGVKYYSFKKNGNTIVLLRPKEYAKFVSLF